MRRNKQQGGRSNKKKGVLRRKERQGGRSDEEGAMRRKMNKTIEKKGKKMKIEKGRIVDHSVLFSKSNLEVPEQSIYGFISSCTIVGFMGLV